MLALPISASIYVFILSGRFACRGELLGFLRSGSCCMQCRRGAIGRTYLLTYVQITHSLWYISYIRQSWYIFFVRGSLGVLGITQLSHGQSKTFELMIVSKLSVLSKFTPLLHRYSLPLHRYSILLHHWTKRVNILKFDTKRDFKAYSVTLYSSTVTLHHSTVSPHVYSTVQCIYSTLLDVHFSHGVLSMT
jgi:hypothetical protein